MRRGFLFGVLLLAGGIAWAILAAAWSSRPLLYQPANIVQIRLLLSNVHLIKGDRPVLVDTGSPGDGAKIEAELAHQGVALRDLSLIVLTHGHADHAGGTVELKRKTVAPIAMWAPDSTLAMRGRNDELRPTSPFAYLVKPFVDFPYPPFTPDILIAEELDLSVYGVRGRVRLMPGHTLGSVIVVLDSAVIAGDMILGGVFGGTVFPRSAGPHYFHADRALNDANIRKLLSDGIKTFYVSHGGPLSREAVAAAYL
jgi:hydroxyacylglutathione hydrolase